VCHALLQDPNFFRLLLRIDEELAGKLRAGGCSCGGVLHSADYPRKPRGCLAEVRSQFESRWSFCCNRCRKRATSMSVRFLGRRVYVALMVVLASTQRAQTRVASSLEVLNLVHNAGAVKPGLVGQIAPQDLTVLVNLHLTAPLLLIQALLPAMRNAHFGRIVTISSRALLGKVNRSIYSATKAGLIGFTRTWALEFGADGITVNSVAPGPIATECYKRQNPPGSQQERDTLHMIAVDRLGTPDDVARAVMFFLEPQNGYVTGQVLYVCGGSSIGAAPL